MAEKKRELIRDKDIQGLKYFDKLVPLLERLHEVGCERDQAGNRQLHFDQYCLLMLLAMFNPIARSMRALQQASELRKVQRKLGCLRFRLIAVKTTPHPKRGKTGGGSAGPASSALLLIATNLLDLPAWVIALLYRYRWSIEIFFRFLKHVLGCRHLFNHDERGIQIQAYCAIIACMLISLWTGRRPTQRTYEMVCYYFLGLADEDELLAHLAKLQRHDASKKR